MRNFYVEYSRVAILPPTVAELTDSNMRPPGAEIQNEILPPLVAEISWTKNVVIMQKCKDLIQREFYMKITKRYGWTAVSVSVAR